MKKYVPLCFIACVGFANFSTPAGAQGYGMPERNNAVAATLRLEEELRDMTGRIERMEHRIDMLERQARQAPPPQARSENVPPPPPPPAANAGNRQSAEQYPSGGYRPASPQPIPQAPENSPFGAGSSPEGVLRAEELYDQALNALKNDDYATSQELFNRFLDTHKEHSLTANAHYWLGESYYAEKSYSDAAMHFLNGYQSAPEAHKAPDNLLKLAMSLRYMKKREEACATLDKLMSEFAGRPSTSVDLAQKERRDLGCD